MDKAITLTLTTEQINRILPFLLEAPYTQVADVIDAIKNQSLEQLQPKKEEAKEEEKEIKKEDD